MKIKKGDKVKVIAGDDKGVVGEVVAVLPKSNRVIVEGVNVNKMHKKPSNENPDGGIVNKELPINTYFTIQSSGAKMYDLSINLYNYVASAKDENFKYYMLTKNSKMEEKEGQFVSDAVSPELAKELRGETDVQEEPSTN